jgi:hypothetical protein
MSIAITSMSDSDKVWSRDVMTEMRNAIAFRAVGCVSGDPITV